MEIEKKKSGRPPTPNPNETPSVDLTHTAYSYAKNEHGDYVLITVKYNPITGQTGAFGASPVQGDELDAQSAFRIIVAQNLFG